MIAKDGPNSSRPVEAYISGLEVDPEILRTDLMKVWDECHNLSARIFYLEKENSALQEKYQGAMVFEADCNLHKGALQLEKSAHKGCAERLRDTKIRLEVTDGILEQLLEKLVEKK